MRYYNISVIDPILQETLVPSDTGFARIAGAKSTWSSLASDGSNLPGALNIELDVQQFSFDAPMAASYARIWGIALPQIGRASDLNNLDVEISGGMSAGLPLANPAQRGIIARGSILQAFGNWINTDMTLDLIMAPPFGAPVNIQNPRNPTEAPANIVLNWPAGLPLGTAIYNALHAAFPDYDIQVAVSQNLIKGSDQPGYYQTVNEFATALNGLSRSIIGGSYPGISITVKGKQIVVFDGTQPVNGLSPQAPRQIAFNDLIGQPTWIGFNEISVKVVMRGDLSVGDYVKMPPSLATTTPQSFSQYRQASVFQSVFQIERIRHVGNFRQPDAASWVSVVDAYVTGTA